MKSAFLPALVSLAITCGALAQPPGELGVQPRIMLVDAVNPDAKSITLVDHVNVYKSVPKVVPVTIEVNGMKQVVNQTVVETVAVLETRKIAFTANGKNATDPTGNPITNEDLFKRLKPGIAVLVLPSVQKLSPAVQRLYSKDAVVLISDGK